MKNSPRNFFSKSDSVVWWMAMNYFIIFPAYFPPKMRFNGQSFRCLLAAGLGSRFGSRPSPFNTFWRFPIRFRLHGFDIVFYDCYTRRITAEKLLVPFFSTKLRDSLVCFIYVYWSLTFFIRFNWFNGRLRQPDKFTQPNRQRPGRQTVCEYSFATYVGGGVVDGQKAARKKTFHCLRIKGSKTRL